MSIEIVADNVWKDGEFENRIGEAIEREDANTLKVFENQAKRKILDIFQKKASEEQLRDRMKITFTNP